MSPGDYFDLPLPLLLEKHTYLSCFCQFYFLGFLFTLWLKEKEIVSCSIFWGDILMKNVPVPSNELHELCENY